MKTSAKLTAPEFFDDIVFVEIPNIIENENLYLEVIRHMIHGPCDDLNINNICMKIDGRCRNDYSKTFCYQTTKGKNGYQKYRRHDESQRIKIRVADLGNNQWVVPYNPYLQNLIVTSL